MAMGDGGPQLVEGSRGHPAPSLPLLRVLWHTFPPKFYFPLSLSPSSTKLDLFAQEAEG